MHSRSLAEILLKILSFETKEVEEPNVAFRIEILKSI